MLPDGQFSQNWLNLTTSGYFHILFFCVSGYFLTPTLPVLASNNRLFFTLFKPNLAKFLHLSGYLDFSDLAILHHTSVKTEIDITMHACAKKFKLGEFTYRSKVYTLSGTGEKIE